MKTNLPFYKALELLIKGKADKIRLSEWKEKGNFVSMKSGYPSGFLADDHQLFLHNLEKGQKISHRPYLIKRDFEGAVYPWTPSQYEIFSNEWETA